MLVLLALLAGAAVVTRWLARDIAATPEALRLQLALPPDQSIPADYRGRVLAIVADGSEVFYVAAESGNRYVFRRRLNSTTAERVPGTEGASSLAVAPDASQLLFHRSGEIWLVDLAGQTSRLIANPNDAWNPTHSFLIGSDGTIFVTVAPRLKNATNGSDPLSQSPPRAANEIYSSKDGKQWRWEGPASDPSGLRGEEFQFPQQLLPNGHLLFSAVWSPRDRSVYLRDRESFETRLLAEQAMGGHITEDGTLLAFWDGKAFAQPSNAGGPPSPRWPLADRVMAAGWSAGQMDVARNGTMVYLEAPQPASLELVWVDSSGKQTPVPAPARPYSLLDLSPDGDRVLVGLSESATIRSIWSYSLRTGEWVRLAEDAPEPCTGIWSPGGAHAMLTSYFGDLRFPNLAAAEAGGKSASYRLFPSDAAQFPTSWPGAGAPIAFVRSEVKGTQTDIGLLFPQSGGNRRDTAVLEPAPGMEWRLQMLAQPGDQRHPAISPDGKLLAFAYGILDDASIRVCALPDCTTATTVPESAGGIAPLWDEAGQALFFRRKQSVYVARLRSAGQGAPVFSPAVKLFEGDFMPANFWNREMVYDPRGRRFLLTRFRKAAEPVRQIHVVLNWPSLLQQASALPQ